MVFLKRIFFILVFVHFAMAYSQAQKIIADTLVTSNKPAQKDSNKLTKKKIVAEPIDSTYIINPKARKPRVAAFRSAIVPGLGQVYNHKYWKVPIVYAAIGGLGWYFFYNLKWYKEYRLGYKVAVGIHSAVSDSTGYNKITDANTKYDVDNNYQNDLKAARDNVRKDLDYSAVYFVLAWLLNVADATVDAHLSTFDISPNLTFKIQPGYSDLAKTNGISLILKFK
jgi:hypothetical protein